MQTGIKMYRMGERLTQIKEEERHSAFSDLREKEARQQNRVPDRGQASEQASEQKPEQTSGSTPEQVPELAPKQTSKQTPGQAPEQAAEQATEQASEQTPEHGENILYLTTSRNMLSVLSRTGMNFEGTVSLREVGFSKVEAQQECLWGSLYIPNMADIMGTRRKILFFVNRRCIVIVDDYDYSGSIIRRIQTRRAHQADTNGRFLYNFLTEIINGDLIALGTYERNLIALEERISLNRIQNFQSAVTPLRNELLILQGYYDEMRDLGRELEEDENGFFNKDQEKYFGVFTDRADRLMNKSAQLLEYAKQIKDDYQTAITAKQNATMQFLTIISTIFMPLTLITSWYGMNFQNMPELENGYPFVIGLSLCVIAVTLLLFKRKKLL